MSCRSATFASLCCISGLLLLPGCSRSHEGRNSTSSVVVSQNPAATLSAGRRSTQLTPEQAAVMFAIQKKIESDPRIHSKSFTVTLENRNGPAVMIRGSVADVEERFAVLSDVESTTDYGVGNTLSLEKREPWEITHTGPAIPRRPFLEPSKKPNIPICPGLTIVTALAQPDGDYESIKTVESADSDRMVLTYSAETKDPWWETPNPQVHLTTARRDVLFEDLRSAHSYDQIFVDHGPEDAKGSTSIGVSSAVLQDLKSNGDSQIKLCGGATTGLVLDTSRKPKFVPGGCYGFYDLTLHRVEDATVPVRVLLNGIPVELPAVHVMAKRASDYWSEFYFLDDDQNPLTLAFRLGINYVRALSPETRRLCETKGKKGQLSLSGDPPSSCDLPMGGDAETLHVIRINTDCRLPERPDSSSSAPQSTTSGEQGLEESLASGEKVNVYTIFFSFNSDALRDESEPTLKEIANVLRRHEDWKLRIAGHTDGIGNEQANLDLSRRRAESVKAALVSQYGIDAARLSTTGFGKSQPIETNDTIEGRARNRRVELSRMN